MKEKRWEVRKGGVEEGGRRAREEGGEKGRKGGREDMWKPWCWAAGDKRPDLLQARPCSQAPGWAAVSPDIRPHLHHNAHQVSECDHRLTGGLNGQWGNNIRGGEAL